MTFSGLKTGLSRTRAKPSSRKSFDLISNNLKKVCHEEDGFRPDKRHHLDELVNGRRLLRRVDREPSRLVLVVVWIPAPDVVPVTLKYLAEFFDLMLPNLLPGLNHFKCSLYSLNSPFGEHFVQESQKKLRA